jgi:DNA-binding NarL/FixJ family response regulator
MPATVLIADDHTLVAEGLEKLLEHDFRLCGRVGDGRALVKAVEQYKPDIALVDIALPLLNGLDACRQIKKSVPEIRLLILTMHGEQYFVTEAFRAGASGYLLKQSVAEELIFAIKEVLKGRRYVSPSVADNLVERALNPGEPGSSRVLRPTDKLSARQREVLQLIAEGQSTKEIASTLNVSIKTVEFHKTRIMKQLGVHSTAELTKQAIAIGLIAMPQQPTVPGPQA